MMRPVNVHVTSVKPASSTLTGNRPTRSRSVDLQWDDPTSVNYSDPTTWGSRQAEIGYRVERSTFTPLGQSAYQVIGTALANATAFTDTDSDPNGAYVYRVVAWNEGGEAASSLSMVSNGSIPTAVTLTSSLNPSASGDRVTFTADLSSSLITGSVVFSIDGVASPAVALSNGKATMSTSALAIGSRNITARYGGDTNFAASTGSLTQVVAGYATRVTLQSNRTPSLHNQSVTFTATVRDVARTHGTPTGAVRFTVTGPTGAVLSSTVALNARGVAAYTTAALLVGDSVVTAEYLPTGRFAGSSATLTQTVRALRTTTELASNRPTSNYGQAVSLTAKVQNNGGTATVPTGSVQFTITNPIGAPTVATVALNGGGVAVYSSTTMSIGVHTVTALYQPSGGFATSSATLTQTVIAPPIPLSVTTIFTNRTASVFGQPVSLTAAVRTLVADTGVPTGSVKFTITNSRGPSTVATVPLDNMGRAVYTTSTLSVGIHSVVALYVPSGALGLAPSVAALTQIVGAAVAAAANVLMVKII